MKIILAMTNRHRVHAFPRIAAMIVCAKHAYNRRGQPADDHQPTMLPGNRPPALLVGLNNLSSSDTSGRHHKSPRHSIPIAATAV
jgi:hypothetical protein